MSTFRPAEVFHPSEIIDDELEARGLTRDHLAAAISGGKVYGVERLALDFYALKDPGIQLSEKDAANLERALGISAHFWLETERIWRERSMEVPPASPPRY